MKTLHLILKILASLVVPIIAGVSIYFLTWFLPDSRHIIMISAFGYFFTALSTSLFLFDSEKARIVRYSARTALFVSISLWITLFFNVFYLYHIATALTVGLIIFYFALDVAICLFIGKQKPFLYAWVFVAIVLGGFFNYLTVVTLIYSHSLYSTLLCGGSTLILIMIFYYMIDQKKYHFRHSKVVRFILMVTSQALLAASTVLMIR